MAQPGRFFVQDEIASPDGCCRHVDGERPDRRIGGLAARANSWLNKPASRPAAYAQLADVPEPFRARLCRAGAESRAADRGPGQLLPATRRTASLGLGDAGGLRGHRRRRRHDQYAVLQFRPRRRLGHGRAASARSPAPSAGATSNCRTSAKCFRWIVRTSPRWRGWLRHMYRDQLAVWMLARWSAWLLPCMLSLEFIRHAPVSGDRVAAMMADGMADRYPQFGQFLWVVDAVMRVFGAGAGTNPGRRQYLAPLDRHHLDLEQPHSQAARPTRCAGSTTASWPLTAPGDW